MKNYVEKKYMYNTSKICDAADWFDPEIKTIIENELREPAKLHRKQWEFAMIFLTLKKYGLIENTKTGLSLGGGNERVLYAIGNHVKTLYVTDLYDQNTSWDCARTEDPDEFIKASKPFPVDDGKLQAIRMDMRFLDFDNNTFDFCYSSCAIEHIGEDNDFLQHLNEVNRVLKEGGIYVLTTELQFGEKTIPDQNNYVFNKEHLSNLISESKLYPILDVNTELTHNEINYPFPSNIRNISFLGNSYVNDKLFNYFPHLILTRGKVPFTSVLLVLGKGGSGKLKKNIKFKNYYETKKFLVEGIESYQKLITENKLSISPFSSLPNGVSKFYLDHSDYFTNPVNLAEFGNTIFHSDYYCFGRGKRKVKINIKVDGVQTEDTNIIQLRIHSYLTYSSKDVVCIYEKDITVNCNILITEIIELETDDDTNYGFLCKLISGNVICSSISIESYAITKSNDKSSTLKELIGATPV